MGLVSVGNLLYPNFAVVSSPSNCLLDAAEEHIAGVLLIPQDGTLLKIGIRLTTVSSPDLTLKVSLETVADTIGIPVATSDAGKTLYAANAQSAAIVNPAAGVRWDAINGASPGTGIPVTKGDLVSVVVRCTAYTSGSASVGYDPGTLLCGLRSQPNTRIPYWYTYLGGAGAVGGGCIGVVFEYDTGIVYAPFVTPASVAPGTYTWNSGSNPDRRGLTLNCPWGCKLRGALISLDTDEDVQIILYDTDEYSVVAGFPITLQGNMRRANGLGEHFVEFPTEPTLTANLTYRLVVLPATVTNIGMAYWVPADDGAVLGMAGLVGGADFCYTTFNGTPTAGSHAWTNDATIRPCILPVVSQIDIPAGGGGRPELRGGNL